MQNNLSSQDSTLEENTYLLKIPAFISKLKKIDSSSQITVYDMRNEMVQNINNYNKGEKIQRKYHKDTLSKTISNIDLDRMDSSKIDNIPLIIGWASEFKKGFTDKFLINKEKSNLKESDKIGSDKNCFIMYPQIEHKQRETYCNWIIFAYIGPGKEFNDVINTIKLILKQVCGLSITHIKNKSARERIKQDQRLSKVSSHFVTFKRSTDSSFNLGGIKVKSSFKTTDTIVFENADPEKVIEILNKKDIGDDEKRTFNIEFENGEKIKIVQTKNNTIEEGIKEVVQQYYNYEIEIDKDKLTGIYSPAEIIKNIKKAIVHLKTNE